jgi:hypothetical protein
MDVGKNDGIFEKYIYKKHKVDVDETFFKCKGLANFQP